MKKARKFTLLTIIAVLFAFVLSGCGKTEDPVVAVSLKDHDPSTAIEISSGDFDFSRYTVAVSYESGNSEEMALSSEMILETDIFKLHQVGDHDITISYGGQKYTFKVSVKRATFGNLSFPENNVFTYDGNAHTVEVDGEIPANASINYIGGNSFVNAGTYKVTAVVSCEGYVTETLSTTVTIERAKYDMSGVKFEDKEVVYDGNAHSLVISGTLPQGVSAPKYTINDKTTSSAIDVGEYTVKATFANNNPNYEPIPPMEAKLKITPAEYIIDGVEFVFKSENGSILNDATKTYDGKSVIFDLNDYNKLPKKVSVSFSVYDKDGEKISASNKNTGIINVGVYTVKAEFVLENSKNYKPIAPIECTFEVFKNEYPTIGDIQFVSAQTTYDGKEHSIVIEGMLPEGVTVSYEYYKGNVLVTDEDGNPVQSVTLAGRYTVKAIFAHNDENSGQIPALSATLNVEKAKVNTSLVGLFGVPTMEYSGEPYEFRLVTWKEINGTDYDILQYGAIKYYRFDSETNKYVEMGENEFPTEVGVYRASVTLTVADGYAGNYSFSNGENTQTLYENVEIQKKKITVPDVTFEGEDTIVYTGNENEIKFSVNGTNMDMITVSAVYFQYVTDKYTAMEDGKLPTDKGSYRLVVTVAIGDESRYIFRNGNYSKEFSFDFMITPQVIDVSGITLNQATVTYNGANQLPTLANVPEHVIAALTVYPGGGTTPTNSVINAGKYRCEVTVKTDSSNYKLSSNTTIFFEYEVIPQTISVEGLEFDSLEFTYDGNPHLPKFINLPEQVKVSGNVFSINGLFGEESYVTEAIEAGKYKYNLWLAIPKDDAGNINYVLSGTTKYTVEFEIKPSSIVIADIDKLLSQPGFYIELPYGDGLYKHEEDDPVHMDAILAAVFGDNKGFAKFETGEIGAPKNSVTGKFLHELLGIDIDASVIYTIECRLAVTDRNQYSFFCNGLYVQIATVTFNVKFV